MNTKHESIKNTVKSHINVKNVGKHSFIPVLFEHMKGLTLERNPMNVNSVEKPFYIKKPSKHTKEVTQERNPINANNVVRDVVLK